MQRNIFVPESEHILYIQAPRTFKSALPYSQRVEYELIQRSIMLGTLMNNYPLTKESQLTLDALLSKRKAEHINWLRGLKGGEKVDIFLHEDVGVESCDGTVVGVSGSEISVQIDNTYENHHFTTGDLLKFTQGDGTMSLEANQYSIEDSMVSGSNQTADALLYMSLEREIPGFLLEKLEKLGNIIGNPRDNTMIANGTRYTVVKKLDGWNIVKHEDGVLGLIKNDPNDIEF